MTCADALRHRARRHLLIQIRRPTHPLRNPRPRSLHRHHFRAENSRPNLHLLHAACDYCRVMRRLFRRCHPFSPCAFERRILPEGRRRRNFHRQSRRRACASTSCVRLALARALLAPQLLPASLLYHPPDHVFRTLKFGPTCRIHPSAREPWFVQPSRRSASCARQLFSTRSTIVHLDLSP